jgi:hypothetical protein
MKYRILTMGMAIIAFAGGAAALTAGPAWATAARPGLATRAAGTAGTAGTARQLSGLPPVRAHRAIVPAGPGQVASRPAALASTFHICLLNASSLCLQSNGAGNQVTITSASGGYSNFHVVNTAADGSYYVYQFDNGNGNCLRAGSNGVVKIENGSCSASDSTDWWVADGNYLVNYGYGEYMLTHGNASGDNVWWGADQSGDWVKWSY